MWWCVQARAGAGTERCKAGGAAQARRRVKGGATSPWGCVAAAACCGAVLRPMIGMRPPRQTGMALGERLKAAWKWAAVLGQVEVYGWQKLNVRCAPIPFVTSEQAFRVEPRHERQENLTRGTVEGQRECLFGWEWEQSESWPDDHANSPISKWLCETNQWPNQLQDTQTGRLFQLSHRDHRSNGPPTVKR